MELREKGSPPLGDLRGERQPGRGLCKCKGLEVGISLEELNKGHCGWSCEADVVGRLEKGMAATSQAIFGIPERSAGFILLGPVDP